MEWNRTTAIFSVIGAAALGYGAVMLARRWSGGEAGFAPGFSAREQHHAGDPNATRSAGRDAMRDPPRHWDRVDESVDESFPASDPAPVGSRID